MQRPGGTALSRIQLSFSKGVISPVLPVGFVFATVDGEIDAAFILVTSDREFYFLCDPDWNGLFPVRFTDGKIKMTLRESGVLRQKLKES